MKAVDLVERMRIARRMLHIDFLKKIAIEKGMFDIYLKQLPMLKWSY